MAEILGIIAGVVGILDVGVRASTGLAEILYAWKNSPPLLLALQNDIADLTVILDEVRNTASALEKNGESASVVASALTRQLRTARQSLNELESLVDSFKDLTKVKRAVKWAKRQHEAVQLHGQLRDVRTKIRELLVAYTASSTSRIELEILSIRQTHAADGAVDERLSGLEQTIGSMNIGHSTLPVGKKVMKADNATRESNRTDFLSLCSLETSTALVDPVTLPQDVVRLAESSNSGHERLTAITAARQIISPTPRNTASSSEVATADSLLMHSESYTAFMLQRLSSNCDLGCRCSCHTRRNSWSSSRVLQSVVGSLFLTYTGMPVLSTPCDLDTCQTNRTTSIHVRYIFPSWLFYHTLDAAMKSSSASSFELNVAIRPRIAWSYTNLFGMIDLKDFVGAQNYIRKHPSSVHAVWDRNGSSPLQYAVTSGSIDIRIIRLLVQSGSTLDLQNGLGLTAVQHVSLKVFRKLYSPAEEQAIREILPISLSRGADHDFTLVHKVVLGLCSLDLATLLAEDPGASQQLNHRDIFGNTPLHWASSSADVEVVRTLVEAGSDPNVTNNMKKTPLLVAASAQNFERAFRVVQLLLDHDGDPHVMPPDGWGPLQWACYWQNIPLVKLLLQHGADLNRRSLRNGVFGAMPLIDATQRGRLEMMRLLLRNGADIDIRDFDGRTPLYFAVFAGHRDAVRLLLAENADHTTVDRLGRSLLHCCAERGGIQMMELLANQNLKGLDAESKDNRGMTAAEIFACRGEESSAGEEKVFNRREEVSFAKPVEKSPELENAFRSLLMSLHQDDRGGEGEDFFDALEDQ